MRALTRLSIATLRGLSILFSVAPIVGCAVHPPNGTVTSADVARELRGGWRSADNPVLPLKDVHGNRYELNMDELVRAPTPPDGQTNVTTVRLLVDDCKAVWGTEPPRWESPTQKPCWMNRTLQITPVRTVPEQWDLHWVGTLLEVTVVTAAIAAVGGTVYCAFECPKPWNVVVPVGVPVVLFVGFLVALSADISRPGGFRFMNAPSSVLRW